jgi:hypothetical protein
MSNESLIARKLELEISDLERPVWKKPTFITPLFAALLSIALGHYSGWFNVQLTKLENKKYELNKEIENFEKEKEVIVLKNSLLISENKNLIEQIIKHKNEIKHSEEMNKKHISEIKSKYEIEISKLKETINILPQNNFNEKRSLENVVFLLEKQLYSIENEVYRIKDQFIENIGIDKCTTLSSMGPDCENLNTQPINAPK